MWNNVEPGRLSPSLVKVLLGLGSFGFERQPSHVSLYMVFLDSCPPRGPGTSHRPTALGLLSPSMSSAKKRGGGPGPSLTINLDNNLGKSFAEPSWYCCSPLPDLTPPSAFHVLVIV